MFFMTLFFNERDYSVIFSNPHWKNGIARFTTVSRLPLCVFRLKKKTFVVKNDPLVLNFWKTNNDRLKKSIVFEIFLSLINMYSIVNKGSSLTIVNEGLSLTILNETKNFTKRSFWKKMTCNFIECRLIWRYKVVG